MAIVATVKAEIPTFFGNLGSSGADDAVFQQGDQLGGIAGWGETGLSGADNRQGFADGEMGKSLFESACEMKLGSLGGDAENGFAEAKGAVGGGFEGLCGGIVGGASDDNLYRMMGEERGG